MQTTNLLTGVLDITWYVGLYTNDSVDVLDFTDLEISFEETITGIILEEPSMVLNLYLRMGDMISKWWLQCCYDYPLLVNQIREGLENDELAVYCTIRTNGFMLVEIHPTNQ